MSMAIYTSYSIFVVIQCPFSVRGGGGGSGLLFNLKAICSLRLNNLSLFDRILCSLRVRSDSPGGTTPGFSGPSCSITCS